MNLKRLLKGAPLLALFFAQPFPSHGNGMALAMSDTIEPDESLTYSVEGGGGELPDTPWWSSFEDSTLTQSVETGLASNYDLDAARHNLARADAIVWQSRSSLLPSLTGVVSTNIGPQEVLFQSFGGVPPNVCDPESLDLPDGVEAPEPDGACRSWYYSGSALLQASYKVDLFGQSIAAARSSAYSAKATSHDRDLFALSLSTQIGEAYFDVVAAKEQLKLLEEQLSLNNNLLELTELRYQTGQIEGLDVLQQRQQASAAESRIPSARAQLETSYRRLAALMGQDPTTFRPETPSALPDLPEAPGIGKPSDLLRTRPDLRGSYDRLLSSQASLRSTRRGAMPSLTLNAQAGYQWNDLGLGAGVSTVENVGAGFNVSVPIFRGGLAVSGIQQAAATERATAAGFNQDILGALTEVESALIREIEFAKQLEATRNQAEAARLAFTESQNRYESGVSSYVAMLTALNSYQAAGLSAITVHRSLISTRLQLHLALGGDWTRGLGAPRGEN